MDIKGSDVIVLIFCIFVLYTVLTMLFKRLQRGSLDLAPKFDAYMKADTLKRDETEIKESEYQSIKEWATLIAEQDEAGDEIAYKSHKGNI